MKKKKTPKKDKKLDFKRLRFAEEYIVDWNGKQAAIRAGYSPKTAESQASRLLRNVKVKEYIEECKNKIEQLAGVSKLRAVKQLSKMAFADITQAFDEDGNLKQLSDIDDDVLICIEGIELMDIKEVGLLQKLKFTSRRGVIQDLAKMLGWNEADKLDHTTKGDKINLTPMQFVKTNAED